MKKSTFLFYGLLVLVLLCTIPQVFSQERIAVIKEPFVVLLDPNNGAIINSTFIDLTPLNQGTPKDLLQVNDQIWISDQIEDRIDRFDLDGMYLGEITGGMDNIKGIELVNNSEVWVTNAGSNNGAPGDAVIRFDLNGNNLGFYSTNGISSFDIIDVGGEVYVSFIGTGTSRIERWDYNGNVLGNVVGNGVVTFIQQIELNSANNSVYAAVFSSTGGNTAGLYEFNVADGAILDSWPEGSLRGVAQLGDGNLLVSAGLNYGVKILNPNTGVTTPLWTEASQYFGRVNLTPCVTPPTPTGDANQTFNEGATVEDIVVTPPNVTWFATLSDAQNNTNPLPPGTLLVDGETYYAVNIVNGCLSEPFAVTVTILCTPPSTPTGDANQSFVEGATLDDIVVTPPSVTWFATLSDAQNNTNPLPGGTLLVDGATYYAVNIVNGCLSEPFAVTVSVCTIPVTPSGESNQTLPVGSILSDIIIDPADVTWFASEDDALNNTNPLPNATPVEDGSTYWAVSIDGICSSEPFAVTITILLGINDFENEIILIYPNPVINELSIEQQEIISSITVYTVLGNKVMFVKGNDNQMKIDMSSLPSNLYLVVVKSASQDQVFKVIKVN